MCWVQAISRELAEGKHTGLPEFLGGLPWLLVRFRAALKRPQPAEPAKASHRGPNQDSGGPSAEFAFFALLLQLLMDPVLAAFQVLCPSLCALIYVLTDLANCKPACACHMPSG